MSTSTLLHVVSGAERLIEFRIAVETAFPYHATNYWTIALLRRRMKPDGTSPQLYGEPIGAPYALSVRSLPAAERVVIWPAPNTTLPPLAMNDGDRLYLQLTQTGTPAILDRLTWELDIQKVTR